MIFSEYLLGPFVRGNTLCLITEMASTFLLVVTNLSGFLIEISMAALGLMFLALEV